MQCQNIPLWKSIKTYRFLKKKNIRKGLIYRKSTTQQFSQISPSVLKQIYSFAN